MYYRTACVNRANDGCEYIETLPSSAAEVSRAMGGRIQEVEDLVFLEYFGIYFALS